MSLRHPRGDEAGGLIAGGIAVLLFAAMVVVWVAAAVTRPPGYVGGNPFGVAGDIMSGRVAWTLAATMVAVAQLAFVTVVGLTGWWLWSRQRGGRFPSDRKAKHMAAPRDFAHLSPASVREVARRLRPSLPAKFDDAQAGLLVCRSVRGGVQVRQNWESTSVFIAGPRRAKTTAIAIPAVCDAPGPALSTSNQPDVLDATRELRATRGQLHIFDLQNLAGQKQTCYVDLLRWVTSISSARRLAEAFVDAERKNVKNEWDMMAEALLSNLILAAAVSGETMLQVYDWTTKPTSEEPALVLERFGHGGPASPANAVRGTLNKPDKFRGSIYGTAQEMLVCLLEREYTRWITPQPGLAEFRPESFVRSPDTLYLLSQGGPGSPAPLIAAIVDLVHQAASEASAKMPIRRLDPPLLSILDELANICRLRRLPDDYSFMGKRGIVPVAILQNHAQGITVWGRDGIDKLIGAANIVGYLGGVKDTQWLEHLSKLIGPYEKRVRSTSSSMQGRSVSSSTRKEDIWSVAELAALPFGRILVIPSGSPAILGRTCPWQEGAHAGAIRASLARWDPQAAHYDPSLAPPIEQTAMNPA